MRFKEFMELDEFYGGNFWAEIPGNTSQEKFANAVNMLQTALDVAGIADPTGIADGTNGVIYLIRAAADRQHWQSHLTNALISFVSMIPFGDLVKLLKAKA